MKPVAHLLVLPLLTPILTLRADGLAPSHAAEPPAAFAEAPEIKATSVVMNPERYRAMYDDMNKAVAEVARRYGNPPFTQIQTNERRKAASIRQRLAELDRGERMAAEIGAAEEQLKRVMEETRLRSTQLAQVEDQLARAREELVRAESTLRELRNHLRLPAESP